MNCLHSHLYFYLKDIPPEKYMSVEYSWDIPMRYSQYIRIKFLIKFCGIFRNNIPRILNPTNVTRMFLGGSRNTIVVNSSG